MLEHSVMNSIEPPGSAVISHMAIRRWGRLGQPAIAGMLGLVSGLSSVLVSMLVRNRGWLMFQKMPLMMHDDHGAI